MRTLDGANGNGALIEINVDLHTHAIGDGRFNDRTPDFVARHVEAAVEAGLHCIGVTDHDDLRPGLLAAEYAASAGLPLLVVPGMEITTSDGHLVVLGISEPVAPWRSMAETIAEVRASGALCIVPHPFFPDLRTRTGVDAIERINTRYGDFDVEREDVAVIASSDAHSAADVRESPHYTRLRVERLSWACVVDAIRDRRVEIVSRSNGNQQGRV